MDLIRTAHSGDIPAVLDLWRRSGAEATVTDDEAGVRTLLEHDPGALLVGRHQGAVVGTVIAAWNGWRASLYRVAVDPDHTGAGLGRALVGAAERRLWRLGARRIDAVVVASRSEAVSFWSAVGYEAQDDRVRFVKNLS